MKSRIIDAFLLDNLGESIVVCEDDKEKYIGTLDFDQTTDRFLLYDNKKNIVNIEKKDVNEVIELDHNSLTILKRNGKIILEEF